MAFVHTNITSGGGAGLLATADHSVDVTAAGQVFSSITVPESGWYDVEVVAYAGVTGAIGTDDYNVGLYADPVTADTMVFQRLVPFNPFAPSAAAAAMIPFRTRVYAQSTITLQSLGAGTAACVYVTNLAVAPVAEWNAGV